MGRNVTTDSTVTSFVADAAAETGHTGAGTPARLTDRRMCFWAASASTTMGVLPLGGYSARFLIDQGRVILPSLGAGPSRRDRERRAELLPGLLPDLPLLFDTKQNGSRRVARFTPINQPVRRRIGTVRYALESTTNNRRQICGGAILTRSQSLWLKCRLRPFLVRNAFPCKAPLGDQIN